jgi:hypothetical protein
MSIERDEEEERQRQEAERKKMRLVDRVYDTPPRTTRFGDLSGLSAKRMGRKFSMIFRMTLTTRAMLMAIKARDGIPSDSVFLELLIEAYLKTYRKPPIVIPSEEELIRMFEKKRDDDDAE